MSKKIPSPAFSRLKKEPRSDYEYMYNDVTTKIEEIKDQLDSLHEERGY